MTNNKISDNQAMEAVKTLISWIGDDPNREGLIETPKRVINAYKEFFSGYNIDTRSILGKVFEEVGNYDEIVIVRDIRLESHCEHHMVPIIGKIHIGYIPNKKVVGISKLARLADIYAKRLQTQETMTAQIANDLQTILEPKGVAILCDAAHQCMTTRGVHKVSSSTITTQMTGIFKEDYKRREEFLRLVTMS
jgi:GTP cyclohydrolase I|tara:strand:+ start:24670 stop:25248 length:579 start_codon:yes stop_codon:yes gene_type:complete